jgi:tRNA threonylcarbamoyladenosine biosynthesis protein TsaB
MSLILNIDSAQETASVSLAENGRVISFLINEHQKAHASFLHPAIKRLMDDNRKKFSDLGAVAVTEGPGSYTGLRVGMAAAKGLAFATNKPLITVSSLEAIAASAIQIQSKPARFNYCAMIDARRQEVFTAIFDVNLNLILPPAAIVLNDSSFEEYLNEQPIIFCGSGTQKWKEICLNNNAFFEEKQSQITAIATRSFEKLLHETFADTALSAPAYVKEFYDRR